MLKSILLTLLMGHAMQATIPAGTYDGQARWKDSAGHTGTYKVSTFVQGGAVLTSYFYNNGKAIYAFRMDETSDGFFDVMSNGNKVGEGQCLSVQCHYTADLGGVQIEETLTYWQGHLYKQGSKKIGNVTIAWEEAMTKVK